MKLKERVYFTCPTCHAHTTLKQEESFGCDSCEKPIDDLLQSGNREYSDSLELTIFHYNNESTQLQFCSWRCCFAKLKTIKTEYFVSLPYLTFEKTTKGQTVKDFFACLKPIERKRP